VGKKKKGREGNGAGQSSRLARMLKKKTLGEGGLPGEKKKGKKTHSTWVKEEKGKSRGWAGCRGKKRQCRPRPSSCRPSFCHRRREEKKSQGGAGNKKKKREKGKKNVTVGPGRKSCSDIEATVTLEERKKKEENSRDEKGGKKGGKATMFSPLFFPRRGK